MPLPEPSAGGARRLIQRSRWSWQFHGLAGTVLNVFAAGLKAVRLSPPGFHRWWVRWKDRQFDARFGTDTADRVPLDKLGIADDRQRFAVEYAPTSPVRFCVKLSSLGIRFEDYVFVDLGSGKGRVLLLASEFPFRRIVGVELSEALHQTAVRNIAAYRRRTRQCRTVESIRADAASFPLPPEPLVLYLYNPFHEEILTALLANLRQSLQEHPRAVVLVYSNPVHRQLLDNADFLIDRGSDDPSWAVYESRSEPAGRSAFGVLTTPAG